MKHQTKKPEAFSLADQSELRAGMGALLLRICATLKLARAPRLFLLLLFGFALSLPHFARGAVDSPAVIPFPEKMELTPGVFKLRRSARILSDEKGRATADFLRQKLRPATGFGFRMDAFQRSDAPKNTILLTTAGANAELGPEGYQLTVTPASIVIRAAGEAGLFYGAQTLLQLFPPQIFSPQPFKTNWTVPCARITDRPRFGWRGIMLDVSRHFYTKREVEQVLDLMAMHKLNTFHWHLADDPGWRVQIKKYPKLTEVGAWRTNIDYRLNPNASTAYDAQGRYGGFYTREDIRDIVNYAKALHITVVPEIEMPGHSIAALASYPEYSCFGGSYATDVRPGDSSGVYCAGNDETFTFLENMLSEIFEMFPGQYIHIGGDEVSKRHWQRCPKCQARIKAEGLKDEEELQSYFIRRIEKFINANHRTLIGWSEIRQGGLAQNAVVMDWIGGAVESASAGHDVVMSPTAYCYFDHYQSTDHTTEPRAIGGFLPLEKVYQFEPIPAKLPDDFQSHILGAQANVWTEYIASLKHVEYMIFPRACALCEATWSPKVARNWEDFKRRLNVHEERLDLLGVTYRPENGLDPDKVAAWLKVRP
jgi:hexosaminidase